jgi:hypothetical protein
VAQGVDPVMARFAATHAAWTTEEAGTEDLLVSLADKIWKNKRVPELEDLVVARLAAATGRPVWEEFLELDSVLTRIGDQADERLAFQMSYPTAWRARRRRSVRRERSECRLGGSGSHVYGLSPSGAAVKRNSTARTWAAVTTVPSTETHLSTPALHRTSTRSRASGGTAAHPHSQSRVRRP